MTKQAIESADIRSLRKILQEIVSDTKNSVAKWLKAGELLTRIKSNTKHGDWNDVLQTVQITYSTAYRYMTFWARRSTMNLNEIKAPEDALQLLNQDSVKSSTVEDATTQNQPLTNEKTTSSKVNSEAKSRPSGQRSIHDHGTARATPVEGQKAKARSSASDTQETSRDNSRSSLNGKPEIQLDKVGRPIPENILELWNRAYETGTRLRSVLSNVKCELEKCIGKDLVFAEMSNPSISDAAALHFSLSHILPYAVCPTCQGKLPEKCMTCRHRGFVSKVYWEGPCVGNDLRAMIEKQAKSYAHSQILSA